jgi:twitching motility two-component system response regulator PilH
MEMHKMSMVLIVDDSPTEVHVLKTWLENSGFQTLTAGSGAEGVAKAKSYQPDAIIMDVVMPGMSGFQATRHLTKDPTTGGIPIVMVTTKNQATDRIWGMRQGAVAYLPKPVTERQIVDQVREALAV